MGPRAKAPPDRCRTATERRVIPSEQVKSLAAIKSVGVRQILDGVDGEGFWVSPPLVDANACAQLANLYEDEEETFRSTINMASYGFGSGEYKYFCAPLPPIIQRLREKLYERLAPVANEWSIRRGEVPEWLPDHKELRARCAAAGQSRPTPLLLRYRSGDFNCLHQDLYGEIHFPLQGILLLDCPGVDFEGGELLLVEQRPRRQSKAMVVPITQCTIAVIPVLERPVPNARGMALIEVRHGVSPLRRDLCTANRPRGCTGSPTACGASGTGGTGERLSRHRRLLSARRKTPGRTRYLDGSRLCRCAWSLDLCAYPFAKRRQHASR